MTNDYSSFTNAELSKQIEKMQAELQKKRKNRRRTAVGRSL